MFFPPGPAGPVAKASGFLVSLRRQGTHVKARHCEFRQVEMHGFFRCVAKGRSHLTRHHLPRLMKLSFRIVAVATAVYALRDDVDEQLLDPVARTSG